MQKYPTREIIEQSQYRFEIKHFTTFKNIIYQKNK